MASRPAPASRPVRQPVQQTSAAQPRPIPQPPPQVRSQPAAGQNRPVPPPVAAVNGFSHARTDSEASIPRHAPRQPPPPPVAARKDVFRVLYDFAGQSGSASELAISKDELVEVTRKETNGKHCPPFMLACELTGLGWWLVQKDDGSKGWAPSAYLKEEVSRAPPPPPPMSNGAPRPVVKPKPAPPQPPAKRPGAGQHGLAPAARDSAVSMGSLNGSSGRATPEGGKPASLAGGLAEALRARQASMQGKKDDDDDW